MLRRRRSSWLLALVVGVGASPSPARAEDPRAAERMRATLGLAPLEAPLVRPDRFAPLRTLGDCLLRGQPPGALAPGFLPSARPEAAPARDAASPGRLPGPWPLGAWPPPPPVTGPGGVPVHDPSGVIPPPPPIPYTPTPPH